jgi:uncharacterized protein (TIGR03435 family)
MKLRVAAGLVSLGVCAVWAQKTDPTPVFEVASIRAAGFPTPETIRGGQFRAGAHINAASVDFEFASLADLLPYAFRVKTFQVSGPAWVRDSRWSVKATIPEGSSAAQVPEMMRALLTERFKLSVHREQREQPVYEMLVGKGGAKLEASTEEDSGAGGSAELPGFLAGGPFGGAFGGRGDANVNQSGRGAVLTGGAGGTTQISLGTDCTVHMEFASLTMPALADMLTSFLDRPVVDVTGMKGSYKVALNLPMEAMIGMMMNMARTVGMPPLGQGGGFGGPGGGAGPGGGRGAALGACIDPAALTGGGNSSTAAILSAVQQLGLKLEPRKAPFETIVVDHLEKTPTEN